MSNFEKKYNETMIIRYGKLIYAITLKDKITDGNGTGRNNKSYIHTEDGKIKFANDWCDRCEFDFNNEAHQVAKEIFITELQTDIKRRILELKQLQSIFSELNLSECFGTVLEDNTRLLLEVKEEVAKVSNTIVDKVEDAIRDTVQPIALKKKKKLDEEPLAEEPVEVNSDDKL